MVDSPAPFESTAHDALIAELLGDVGRLHERIKALPDEIERLRPIVDQLEAARIGLDKASTQAQKQFSRDANALLAAHVETTLHTFEERVKQALQDHFSEPMAALRRAMARRLVVFSLAAAVFGGIGSTIATLLILPSFITPVIDATTPGMAPPKTARHQ